MKWKSGREISNLAGVYQIHNVVNGKRYIGSTVCLRHRFYLHRRKLRKGISTNRALQAAWNKYSEHAFRFEVILYCSPGYLLFYEQRAMDAFKSVVPSGYNIGPTAGSVLGVRWTREARIRNSERMVKVMKDPRRRLASSQGAIARGPSSEETRRKISDKLRGRLVSLETRQKLSRAAYERWRREKGIRQNNS